MLHALRGLLRKRGAGARLALLALLGSILAAVLAAVFGTGGVVPAGASATLSCQASSGTLTVTINGQTTSASPLDISANGTAYSFSGTGITTSACTGGGLQSGTTVAPPAGALLLSQPAAKTDQSAQLTFGSGAAAITLNNVTTEVGIAQVTRPGGFPGVVPGTAVTATSSDLSSGTTVASVPEDSLETSQAATASGSTNLGFSTTVSTTTTPISVGSATVTNTSKQVTSTASSPPFAGVLQGMSVTDTGNCIPAGDTVASFDSVTQIELNVAATCSVSGTDTLDFLQNIVAGGSTTVSLPAGAPGVFGGATASVPQMTVTDSAGCLEAGTTVKTYAWPSSTLTLSQKASGPTSGVSGGCDQTSVSNVTQTPLSPGVTVSSGNFGSVVAGQSVADSEKCFASGTTVTTVVSATSLTLSNGSTCATGDSTDTLYFFIPSTTATDTGVVTPPSTTITGTFTGLVDGMTVSDPNNCISPGATVSSISSTGNSITINGTVGTGRTGICGSESLTFAAPETLTFATSVETVISGVSVTANQATVAQTTSGFPGVVAGMTVTDSAGCIATSPVTTVASASSSTSLTLSANSTCSNSSDILTFFPQISTASGSSDLNGAGGAGGFAGVVDGMTVSGTGIPTGTTVTTSPNSLVLDQPASLSCLDQLTFSEQVSNVVLVNNSKTATAPSAAALLGVVPGMSVSGPDLSNGTVVDWVSGNILRLSQSANNGATDQLTFSTPNPVTVETASGSTTASVVVSSSGSNSPLAGGFPDVTPGLTVKDTGGCLNAATTHVSGVGTLSTASAVMTMSQPADAGGTISPTFSLSLGCLTLNGTTSVGVSTSGSCPSTATGFPGVYANMVVTGPASLGIPTGDTVQSVSGNTLTLQTAPTGNNSNNATLTFSTSAPNASSTTSSVVTTNASATIVDAAGASNVSEVSPGMAISGAFNDTVDTKVVVTAPSSGSPPSQYVVLDNSAGSLATHSTCPFSFAFELPPPSSGNDTLAILDDGNPSTSGDDLVGVSSSATASNTESASLAAGCTTPDATVPGPPGTYALQTIDVQGTGSSTSNELDLSGTNASSPVTVSAAADSVASPGSVSGMPAGAPVQFSGEQTVQGATGNTTFQPGTATPAGGSLTFAGISAATNTIDLSGESNASFSTLTAAMSGGTGNCAGDGEVTSSGTVQLADCFTNVSVVNGSTGASAVPTTFKPANGASTATFNGGTGNGIVNTVDLSGETAGSFSTLTAAMQSASAFTTTVGNATTAPSSASVTVPSSGFPGVVAGMIVSGPTGAGIPAGDTVASVSGNSLTLATPTSGGTAGSYTLSFSVSTAVSNVTVTNGGTSVTVPSGGFPGVSPGMIVTGPSAAGIPSGDSVQSVTANTLVLSSAPTGTTGSYQLTFSAVPACAAGSGDILGGVSGGTPSYLSDCFSNVGLVNGNSGNTTSVVTVFDPDPTLTSTPSQLPVFVGNNSAADSSVVNLAGFSAGSIQKLTAQLNGDLSASQGQVTATVSGVPVTFASFYRADEVVGGTVPTTFQPDVANGVDLVGQSGTDTLDVSNETSTSFGSGGSFAVTMPNTGSCSSGEGQVSGSGSQTISDPFNGILTVLGSPLPTTYQPTYTFTSAPAAVPLFVGNDSAPGGSVVSLGNVASCAGDSINGLLAAMNSDTSGAGSQSQISAQVNGASNVVPFANFYGVNKVTGSGTLLTDFQPGSTTGVLLSGAGGGGVLDLSAETPTNLAVANNSNSAGGPGTVTGTGLNDTFQSMATVLGSQSGTVFEPSTSNTPAFVGACNTTSPITNVVDLSADSNGPISVGGMTTGLGSVGTLPANLSAAAAAFYGSCEGSQSDGQVTSGSNVTPFLAVSEVRGSTSVATTFQPGTSTGVLFVGQGSGLQNTIALGALDDVTMNTDNAASPGAFFPCATNCAPPISAPATPVQGQGTFEQIEGVTGSTAGANFILGANGGSGGASGGVSLVGLGSYSSNTLWLPKQSALTVDVGQDDTQSPGQLAGLSTGFGNVTQDTFSGIGVFNGTQDNLGNATFEASDVTSSGNVVPIQYVGGGTGNTLTFSTLAAGAANALAIDVVTADEIGGGFHFSTVSAPPLAGVTVTNGNTTISVASGGFPGVTVGMVVSGPSAAGIPSGDTVQSVSGNNLVLATAPTGTTGSYALSFGSIVSESTGISSFQGCNSGTASCAGTTVFAASGATDQYSGLGSSNTLDFSKITGGSGVSVNETGGGGTATPVAGGSISFSGVQTFNGSPFQDIFTLGTGNATVNGGGGPSTVTLAGDQQGITFTLSYANVTGSASCAAPSAAKELTTIVTSNGTDCTTNINNFQGSSSGGNTFVSDGFGGHTFSAGGTGNTISLANVTSAPSGLTVNATGNCTPLPNCVTSLNPNSEITPSGTSSEDLFTGIQAFNGAPGGTNFDSNGTNNLTFNGGTANSDVLDLSTAPAGTQVQDGASVQNVAGNCNGAVIAGSNNESFSDIAQVKGSLNGGTTFVVTSGSPVVGGCATANASSPTTFFGQGTGNKLDISAVPTSAYLIMPTTAAPTGCVATSEVSPYPAAVPWDLSSSNGCPFTGQLETFQDIQSFVGASAGSTTFVAGPTAGLSFTGQGSGNTLSFADVPSSGGAQVFLNPNSQNQEVAEPGGGSDTFGGITTIIGSRGSDTFFGGPGNYTIEGAHGSAPFGVGSISLTSGSNTITVPTGGFPGVVPGMLVTGTGIPGATTVVSVSGNSAVLSANATSGPTETLTFSEPGVSTASATFSDASGSSGMTLALVNGTGTVTGGFSGTTTTTGVTTFIGASGGGNKFLPDGNGGYSFQVPGSSTGNVLSFANASSGVGTLDLAITSSAGNGTASGLAGGTSDGFQGFQSFVGAPTSNDFTVGNGQFSLVGGGSGTNTLDLTQATVGITFTLATSSGNVSGTAISGGSSPAVQDTLGGFSTYTGSSQGNNTFHAPAGGGFVFNGGGLSGNMLDLTTAPAGMTLTANGSASPGTVTSLATGLSAPAASTTTTSDGFSNMQIFLGSSSSSSSSFTTFAVDCGGGQLFEGQGSASQLVISYTGCPPGTTPTPRIDATASPGTISGLPGSGGNDTFSNILSFVGPTAGDTTFVAPGSASGYTFAGGTGSTGNTFDASAFPSGATLDANAGVAALGLSRDDTFSGVQCLVGSTSGGTTFVAPSGQLQGGCVEHSPNQPSFLGSSSGNVLDLGNVPTSSSNPLTVSPPTSPGTVSNSSGTLDTFAGIQNFLGSKGGYTTFVNGSAGGLGFTGQGTASTNSISFADVPASGGGGVTVSLTPNGAGQQTAQPGGGTDTFSGIGTIAGSPGTDTFLGGPGNFTIDDCRCSIPSVQTTSGSTAITYPSGSFPFFYPGIAVSGTGIPSGTTVVSVSPNTPSSGTDTATLSAAATATNTLALAFGATTGSATFNDSPATTGMSLQLAGGVGTVSGSFTGSTTTYGVTGFVGAPGGGNSFVSDGGSGYTFSGPAGTTGNSLSFANANVSGARIVVASAAGNGTVWGLGPSTSIAGVSTTAGSTTVTVASGGFPGVTPSMTVSGSGIPVGAYVTSVSGNSAVLSAPATSTGTSSPAFWTGTDSFQGFQSFTGSENGGSLFDVGNGTFTLSGVTGSGLAPNLLTMARATTGVTFNLAQQQPTAISSGNGADDFVNGFSIITGASVGNNTFDAPSTGGYTFVGTENATGGNVLNLSAAPANIAITQSSSFDGTVSGFGIPDTDIYTGIQSIVGSPQVTTFIADCAGGSQFTGSSPSTVLALASGCGNLTIDATLGKVTGFAGGASDTFSGIFNFHGSPSGNTTFIAPNTGGYSFTGLASGNTFDASAFPSGASISPATSTATLSLSAQDSFTGVQCFVGSLQGGTTFVMPPAGVSPAACVEHAPNQPTFLGRGTSGNVLDVSNVVASASNQLTVTPPAAPNGTVSNGSGTLGTFANVQSFVGSSAGFTNFVTGSSGGLGFAGGSSSPSVNLTNTLSFADVPASGGVTVSLVPNGAGQETAQPGSGTDTFTGITTISGSPGHDVFVGGPGTYRLEGLAGTPAFTIPNVTGTASSTTLSASGFPGVVPGMSVSGTGIPTGATVASVSGTTLTLSSAATSSGARSVTFSLPGVAGASATFTDSSASSGMSLGLANGTGSITGGGFTGGITATGVSTYVGTPGGGNTFKSDGTGGYTFSVPSGGNNTLSFANASQTGLIVSAVSAVGNGTVTGLSGGSDTFSGLQNLVGSGGGGSTFDMGNGTYTLTGNGTGNTLSFAGDTGLTSGVAFNVAGSVQQTAIAGANVVDDTISGFQTLIGATVGGNVFDANPSGGYEFVGSGVGGTGGDTVNLASDPAGVTATVNGNSPTSLGTVVGLGTGGAPAPGGTLATEDTFSGVTSFAGPSASTTNNPTTFEASCTGGLSFAGAGHATVLELASDSQPACAGQQPTVNAAVAPGSITGLQGGGDTFSNITKFVGPTSGQTTFVAPSTTQGITFEGQGNSSASLLNGGNTLDLSAFSSGSAVDAVNGVARFGTSETDSFSGMSCFVGSNAGGTTFIAPAAQLVSSNCVEFGNSGTQQDFLGNGSGNSLNLSAVPTSASAPAVESNGTVTVGTSVWDTNTSMQTYTGPATGNTTFVAWAPTGGSIAGQSFNGGGQASTNKLSIPTAPQSTLVDTTTHTITLGDGSGTMTFNTLIAGFVGATAGETTFRPDAQNSYSFTGIGGANTIDLTNAPNNDALDLACTTTVNATSMNYIVMSNSPPVGCTAPATGSIVDTFTGMANFVGSKMGNMSFTAPGTGAGGLSFTGNGTGNSLSFAQLPAGPGVTLNLAAGTVVDPQWTTGDTFSGIATFTGTQNADTFLSGPVTASIVGGGGSDTLSFSNADDVAATVLLGTGANGTGKATGGWTPTPAQLTISGIQNVVGSPGGGTITGNLLPSVFTGGQGANDFVVKGGTDVIDGGGGANTLDLSAANKFVTLNLGLSGPQVTGGAGILTVVPGTITNLIGGPDGNRLLAGPGNVTLTGGSGTDWLQAGSGRDFLNAGSGNDTLVGGTGNDTMTGGIGTDTFIPGTGGGKITDTLGKGTLDYALATASSGSGCWGKTSTECGVLVNLSNSNYAPPGVNLTLAPDQSSGGGGQPETLVGISNIIGTNFGDILVGSSSANTIQGGNGTNLIVGNGGGDNLSAGSGTNVFVTGSGNNTVKGGSGTNTIDYASEPVSSIQTNVDLLKGTATNGWGGTDTLSGITNIIGSRNKDDVLELGAHGGEIIAGGGSGDSLIGSTGGNSYMVGGAGTDTFTSTAANDRMFGGQGDDTFIANNGFLDYMTGGTSFNIAYVDCIDIKDKSFTGIQDPIPPSGGCSSTATGTAPAAAGTPAPIPFVASPAGAATTTTTPATSTTTTTPATPSTTSTTGAGTSTTTPAASGTSAGTTTTSTVPSTGTTGSAGTTQAPSTTGAVSPVTTTTNVSTAGNVTRP